MIEKVKELMLVAVGISATYNSQLINLITTPYGGKNCIMVYSSQLTGLKYTEECIGLTRRYDVTFGDIQHLDSPSLLDDERILPLILHDIKILNELSVFLSTSCDRTREENIQYMLNKIKSMEE